MATVAEMAGVGAGTIYIYFETKDALIVEIHSDLKKRIFDAINDQYPESSSIRERFLHIAKTLLGYCISSPMEFKFLEQFHHSPYGVAHRREKLFGKKERDITTDLFYEALEKQIVKDLPLAILFELGFGPLLAIARNHALGFIQLDDGMIERAVEGCWHAIRR